MAALLSLLFSFHTSPSSADHLHHPSHLPTQHVPFKLFLSYRQAPEARLSGAKHLYQQGSFWGAVQSPFTLPGGREMPTSHTCEAHSQCYWTKGGQKSALFFFSGVSSSFLLLKHKEIQHNRGSFLSLVVTIIHPKKGKLEDSNMTSYVCGLCSSKIKDSPDLERRMVKGCIAQSALLL